MTLESNRRSFLGGLASAGLLGATGVQATAAEPTPTETSGSIPTADGRKTLELLGVEALNKDTGDRTVHSSLKDFRAADVAAGSYELIEVFDEDGRIIERTSHLTVDPASETTTTDGIDLRATVSVATEYQHVSPNGTVEVLVGAVERTDGIDHGPASDISLTVELIGRDGSTLQTRTTETSENGNSSVTFDLQGVANGSYSVEVTSGETDSTATRRFTVGPYIGVPFHWTGMTPGEQTTIGVFSAVGGEPESDATRQVSIEAPDGSTETFDVDFGDGGIGTINYTPTQSGSHQFQSDESNLYRSIGCGELKALVPYFEIRDQHVGETVTWGGHIVSDTTPVGNQELRITITDSGSNTVDEFTPVTNEFGQFTIEFEAPEDQNSYYNVDIRTADGREVFLFGDRILFDELPTEERGVEFDISTEDYYAAPGSSNSVEISLLENGGPVTNKEIKLITYYTYDEIPVGTTVAETDADGIAEQSVEIPDDAPDGEQLYIKAFVEHDGEMHTDTDLLSIQQYDIEIDDYGLTPGQTNAVDVTATDQTTGEAVPGIDVTIFGNRYNVDAGTFDSGYTQTDTDGSGEIDLSIPSDVTNDIMVNDLTPYDSASISSGSIESPISADITVSPEQPSPGDTISVTYSTDGSERVSAIATFPSRKGGASTIIREGETGELSVPQRLESGDSERLHLLLLASSGEAAENGTTVTVGDQLTARFSITPQQPTANEAVEFDGSGSTSLSNEIVSHEWDFTGDGTVDTSGKTVHHTYQRPDEYDVELIVTDSNGETDSTTKTIVIDPDDESSGLSRFDTNNNGQIDFSEVIDAISAANNGTQIGGEDVGFQDVLAVIQAFNSGTSV